jgi:hypothetical protein
MIIARTTIPAKAPPIAAVTLTLKWFFFWEKGTRGELSCVTYLWERWAEGEVGKEDGVKGDRAREDETGEEDEGGTDDEAEGWKVEEPSIEIDDEVPDKEREESADKEGLGDKERLVEGKTTVELGVCESGMSDCGWGFEDVDWGWGGGPGAAVGKGSSVKGWTAETRIVVPISIIHSPATWRWEQRPWLA